MEEYRGVRRLQWGKFSPGGDKGFATGGARRWLMERNLTSEEAALAYDGGAGGFEAAGAPKSFAQLSGAGSSPAYRSGQGGGTVTEEVQRGGAAAAVGEVCGGDKGPQTAGIQDMASDKIGVEDSGHCGGGGGRRLKEVRRGPAAARGEVCGRRYGSAKGGGGFRIWLGTYEKPEDAAFGLMTEPLIRCCGSRGAGPQISRTLMRQSDAPERQSEGLGNAFPIIAGERSTVLPVDPNLDPELSLALRVSMEEERARQEVAAKRAEEIAEQEKGSRKAANYPRYDENALLEQALAMSMHSTSNDTRRDISMPGVASDEELAIGE
nr:26S proteasome non-ATPase regulatory subunit 4 homolog [Ipomoea batatas]